MYDIEIKDDIKRCILEHLTPSLFYTVLLSCQLKKSVN